MRETRQQRRARERLQLKLHEHQKPRSTLWIWFTGIPKAAYGLLGFLALLSGFLVFYPWLSLELGDRLRPKDPFGTILNVSDEGYLSLTDVSILCTFDLDAGNGVIFHSANAGYDHFAKSLSYKHKLSLPCGVEVDTGIKKVTLHLTISYNVWHFPGRRTQEFSLVGDMDSDQNWHWLFNN